ncbi:hypothetical protein CPB83DRAFT_842417 [Crepidotus variabilis]|uniref:F-box protein n=1 Tax=Crepidotus variabilis TaxID=179855 RepID=A0A9P6EVL5_9AGAR|nr:hypothetical protein CPB83DRAFT_842417 [Crepidotus variabilis]
MARPEFIEDLIPLILDADNDHWWPTHLATLATVSSAWLFYVRKRLYSYPHIYDLGAGAKLADTLKAHAELKSLVRGISLRVSPNGRPFHDTHLKALRVLLGLEGLKYITLGGKLVASQYLKLISEPDDVENIHIDGSNYCGSPNQIPISSPVFEWDEAFGFGFPNLQTLRLTHVDLHIEVPRTLYPTTITHLILEHVTLRPGTIQHLLNGAPTLTCLHLTCSDPVEEELRMVLSSCGIRCLHYQVQKATCSDPFTDVDPSDGEALRCLHLDGPILDDGMLNTICFTFRNLEELIVMGRTVRIPAQGWVDLISSDSKLLSLRRLGFPWGTNIPPFTVWSTEEMQMVCDACIGRQIDLIL